MSKKSKKRSGKQKGILVFLGIIIIGLSLMLAGYINNNCVKKLDVDKNAIKEEDNEEKMEVSEGGGAVNLTYTNQVIVNKDDKSIDLYFKNPSKSREDLTLEIYLNNGNKEVLIAKSELIPTGHLIKKLDLNDISLDKELYKGYIKVNYYNEKTNEKEVVDTKIDINIIVK